MNNYPKISIITPNFNGGKYLEETILSVINQNYPNLEYIIIDGGSTDNSIEIIKKYEPYLTYWVSESDKGLYDAIKKGFDKSTGEIMAWINSDDMYHRKAFFTVSEIFQNFPFVDWLTGNPSLYDEHGRVIHASYPAKWSKYEYYAGEYEWIQQESVFWRRSLWNKIVFRTDLKYAGDLSLWLSFFRHASLVSTTALIGGFRLRSSNQISLNHLDLYHEEAKMLIAEEQLSLEDKVIVKGYLRRQKIVSYLYKLKVFNVSWIVLRYKNAKFNYPKDLSFNRKTQQFEFR